MAISPKLVGSRLDFSAIFMIDNIELQGDMIILGDLDPRDETKKRGEMIEEAVEISIDPKNPKKTINIGTCMLSEFWKELINCFKEY